MSSEPSTEKWNCLGWKISRSTITRYFAMLNICLLGLGTFVCFDSVGALQEPLLNKFNITHSDFSLMYSVNSWANIVISPFGGFLIDRVFGIRFGTLFYGLVFLAGHMVFALGVTLVTFWCALFGRFINGVGHEFLYISMQLYSVHYFKGKELSLIMCISVSMARLGSSIVYSLAYPILTFVQNVAPGSADVGIVVFIVGSFTILTILSGVILLIMTPKPNQPDTKNGDEKGQVHVEHQKIKLKDAFKLPFDFWLLIFIQISFAVSIYVFLPFTQKLFNTLNGLTTDEANNVTSYFNIIGMVTAPIIGLVVDKVGREVYVIIFGFVCAFLAHLLIGFCDWTPYISMFLLSLSYGLFNGSVLPMMSMLIPEYKLGTAYGVSMTFGNAAYGLCIYLVGLSVDEFGYIGLSVFMLVIVAGGAVISIILLYVDKKNDGILNLSPAVRNARMKKENAVKDEAMEPLKSQPDLNGYESPR